MGQNDCVFHHINIYVKLNIWPIKNLKWRIERITTKISVDFISLLAQIPEVETNLLIYWYFWYIWMWSEGNLLK